MDGQSFELTANLDTDEHFLWTLRKREQSNQYESKTPVVILDRDNQIVTTIVCQQIVSSSQMLRIKVKHSTDCFQKVK